MVNVEEINKIIEDLREDANHIHEISALCTKIAEVGNEVEKQQVSADENGNKLKVIAETMESMQDQYNNALNKLSAATDVLETSATELRTEMKRFENDNNDRLEDFRSKTAAQLSSSESTIKTELERAQRAETAAMQDMSNKLTASLTDVMSGLKTVKIISILGLVCALAAAILAIIH